MRLAQVSTLDRRGSDQSSRCPPFASTSGAKLCRQSRGSQSRERRRHANKPTTCSAVPSSRRRCKTSHRVLQKSSAQLQTAYLTAQADSEWFQSLPPKVQQRHFSVEEQTRLGGWRSSVIFDAADQALYKFGSTPGESSLSLPATSTLSRSSSISSMSSTARFADSGIDVDGSLYDSFRWLDEEDDIDLSLDYHAHLAEAAAASKKAKSSHRRRPSSFRRTFSISSSSNNISALPSPRMRSQTASQPHPLSFNPHFQNSNNSRSRSVSKSVPTPHLPSHLPQSPQGSIDHPAQFYQDPEARLKLRVYLASPQKFDEAIEFGFPSLEHNDNLGTPFFDRKWKMQESPTAHNFLDSDFISPLDSNGPPSPRQSPRPATSAADLTENTWRKPSVCDSQHSRPSFSDRRPRPHQPMVLNSSNLGSREMTLKMTLTRPDLRSSDLLSSPKTSTCEEDPLKLADLPVVDEKATVWDKPEKCSVKSVWRKITRR
ncbi:mucin [Arthroderma uncinatum]|uniref:mucin n=1 Tax=Arthroderma uncinatum TaxID=74035 RepID=UPI00144A73D8|nr:mucin [Arthroderma uncinatum]KAF3481928.1 mucin [Arthroderma uncinatum]